MTIHWSNNASTTIAGSITAVATEVQLAPGSGVHFPALPNSGDYFVATFYDQQTKTLNEIVHVTGYVQPGGGTSGTAKTDTVVIVRGQEGTDTLAWSSGDIFANLITAGTLDAFVQAGSGPADTSIVYVGDDVSTDNTKIVATTIPVPPNYALGMLFNIRMKNGKVPNSSTGSVTMELNGQPGVPVKRTDGSDIIPGNLVQNQDYGFIYNGVNFNSYIPPIPQAPPQLVFYVRADAASVVNMTTGLETGSGLADTVQDAFRTVQGAINTIKSRYISSQTLTLRVHDGYYTSGGTDSGNYISAWAIIGNTSNPAACTIDCTSTTSSTYVPGSTPGVCFAAGPAATMSIQGFSFKSLSANVLADGGGLDPANCNFTAPTSGTSCIECAFGGNMVSWGTNQYSGSNVASAIWAVGGGGHMSIGEWDQYGFSNIPMSMTFVGLPTVGYVFLASTDGYMGIMQQVCTFAGGLYVNNGPNNFSGRCDTAGGMFFSLNHTPISGLGSIDVQSPGWLV